MDGEEEEIRGEEGDGERINREESVIFAGGNIKWT